ncbi:MAG: Gfo/Idh/MocA family oxidoreductase [Planctomycetota bacterium]
MTTLRFGILGTGNIAKQFAADVRKSERCRITAVGSRTQASADGFAEQFGPMNRHGNYDALLADDEVDTIYVSTPNTLHREWTEKALAAGKHVLCEKPLATSRADAEAMFAAAEAADRVLVEAFMYRAHPQTLQLQRALREGAIGNVKLVRASFCYRTRKIDGNVRFDSNLAGGALMDVGCYCINAAMMVAGTEPESWHAISRMHERGVDEQTTGVLKFSNGVVAEFSCALTTQANNTLHICGDEGWIEVPVPWKPPIGEAGFTIHRGTPPKQDGPVTRQTGPEWVDVPDDRPLYAIEADAFAATVLDGTEAFMPQGASLVLAGILEDMRSGMIT